MAPYLSGSRTNINGTFPAVGTKNLSQVVPGYVKNPHFSYEDAGFLLPGVPGCPPTSIAFE